MVFEPSATTGRGDPRLLAIEAVIPPWPGLGAVLIEGRAASVDQVDATYRSADATDVPKITDSDLALSDVAAASASGRRLHLIDVSNLTIHSDVSRHLPDSRRE